MEPDPFDPEHGPPTPEQIASWNRRSNPPDNEVPAHLPWSALLARGDDVAVILTGARLYSTGIRLDIAVRARVGDQVDLFSALDGYGRRGADRILLGVEYVDGRVATNVGHSGWPPPDRPDTEPTLTSGGGSGGDRSVDISFFLSPLPPPGPVVVVCAWPGRGVAETRTVLDGTASAADQVQVLWPPDETPPGRPEPPPPPDVPDGGWFARAMDR